jgi:hypothetical protein
MTSSISGWLSNKDWEGSSTTQVMEEEGLYFFKAFTAGSVRMTSPTALSLKIKIL